MADIKAKSGKNIAELNRWSKEKTREHDEILRQLSAQSESQIAGIKSEAAENIDKLTAQLDQQKQDYDNALQQQKREHTEAIQQILAQSESQIAGIKSSGGNLRTI